MNLTQESPKLLEAGKKLDMTYSVKWVQTNVAFARRFEVYLDYPFFEHQVILPCTRGNMKFQKDTLVFFPWL